MNDSHNVLQSEEKNAMADFGQIKSINYLPADKIILAYISQAMKLTNEGVKLPRKEKVKEVPDLHQDFINALASYKSAKAHFNKFSPSQRREYIKWINDAKTEATHLSVLQMPFFGYTKENHETGNTKNDRRAYYLTLSLLTPKKYFLIATWIQH